MSYVTYKPPRELPPCPFCGSDEIHTYSPGPYEIGNDASVSCENPICGAEVRGRTLKEAIAKWNRRAGRMTNVTVDRERVYELLIKADDKLTDLGLDLMHRWKKMTGDSCGWDPDAYYTPLENVLHHIAELFGYDYNRDIAAEAYRRRKEGKE